MIKTPANCPRIEKVIAYQGYRTFDLHDDSRVIYPPIYHREYTSGDDIDQLKRDLAKVMGTHFDNHHGWIVAPPSGGELFFYFSDWNLYVWRLIPKVI